jgi:hypothetical protein
MSQTPRLILALGLTAVLAGCLGVNHGHPESRGPRYVSSQKRADVATPVRWRQIFLGSPPKPVMAGYLRTEERGQNRGGHVVYDPDFRIVGRISPKGNTVRVVQGVERSVGGYALKNALRRLYLRDLRVEVNLKSMPAPRG